jgi:4-carboxymuconolactone decarboxylase
MMKPFRAMLAVLTAAAAAMLMAGSSANSLAAQGPGTPVSIAQEAYNAKLPKDVHPDSRSRLPLIKREDLDAEGKKAYDSHLSGDSASLAGLQGPGGLQLHGSKPSMRGKGLGPRLQELARLVVAREMDQIFEWTVHEPRALKVGLEPAIIDVVRYRRPLTGVGEKEAAVIQLGREVFQKHHVESDTYARAVKLLGEKNLVDLCYLMGSYTTTAILLHTVDLHLPYDRKPKLPVPYTAGTETKPLF